MLPLALNLRAWFDSTAGLCSASSRQVQTCQEVSTQDNSDASGICCCTALYGSFPDPQHQHDELTRPTASRPVCLSRLAHTQAGRILRTGSLCRHPPLRRLSTLPADSTPQRSCCRRGFGATAPGQTGQSQMLFGTAQLQHHRKGQCMLVSFSTPFCLRHHSIQFVKFESCGEFLRERLNN